MVRLISDMLELSNALNIDGFLETVDIEKTFDSVNHTFYIRFKNFWFCKSLL